VRCECESLDLWKQDRRGVKPPNSWRSARVLRLDGCSAGKQTELLGQSHGGSISPLERHAEWILTLVSEQSDLTLDEIVSAMHKKRIRGSRTALWRFFGRHGITVKKKPASGRTAASRRGSGASTLDS
jgi:hypothetical protein